VHKERALSQERAGGKDQMRIVIVTAGHTRIEMEFTNSELESFGKGFGKAVGKSFDWAGISKAVTEAAMHHE
jgi:hypothetical protein